MPSTSPGTAPRGIVSSIDVHLHLLDDALARQRVVAGAPSRIESSIVESGAPTR